MPIPRVETVGGEVAAVSPAGDVEEPRVRQPEEMIPRTASLLAGPFRVEGESLGPRCPRARAFAFYGDPRTRALDAVWEYTMEDCVSGTFLPLEKVPVGARLVDAFAKGDGVYAVLESVAARGQPGGLRAVIDVTDPRPSGLVPPRSREELLPLLPIADVDEGAVFARDAGGQLREPSPRSPLPAPETWAMAEGIAEEEIFQDYFSRETRHLALGDPRISAIARGVRGKGGSCRRHRVDFPTLGLCWGRVAGQPRISQVSFARSPVAGGRPLVRAIGSVVPTKQLLGERSPVLSVDEHRASVQAVAARLPLPGRIVATGPLGESGGSAGIFVTSTSPYRVLLLRVDGRIVSVSQPGPLGELNTKGLTATSRLDAAVIEMPGERARFLVRLERPGTWAWTTVLWLIHPFEDDRAPTPGPGPEEDQERALRLRTAKTFAEAEAVVRAPPLHATRAELVELFSKIGDRSHLLAHAAKNAAFIDGDAANPGDAKIRPLGEISDELLGLLRDFGKQPWVRTPERGGDEVKRYFAQTGPSSDIYLQAELQLVREDGKLRVAAALTR